VSHNPNFIDALCSACTPGIKPWHAHQFLHGANVMKDEIWHGADAMENQLPHGVDPMKDLLTTWAGIMKEEILEKGHETLACPYCSTLGQGCCGSMTTCALCHKDDHCQIAP
jgi:hypothetical protein